MTNAELTHELKVLENRLANLEKRFVNVEHRTLPQLENNKFIDKACPKCGVNTVAQREDRQWCSTCGYKNWTDDTEGPIGL